VRNWTLETDARDIAWLGIRTQGSANTLSREVLLELDVVLEALEKAPPAALIIFSPKESGFVAGADVKEFLQFENPQQAFELVRGGQKIIDRLAALPIATVAVLNGTALGGGLELALACDWRLSFASDRPALGLPEVQLGVHPGLGGTVRCTRLIGVRAAMSLMLTGKPIRPDKALSIGLIDRVTSEKSWRADAAEFALRKRGPVKPPLVDQLLGLPLLKSILASTLRKQVAAKAKRSHYPAPYAIIDLWQQHFDRSTAMEAEARSFAELVFSSTAQNLVRVFFLQDRMKKLGNVSDAAFNHVHVVGAGTMGADIAAWCAIRGLSVTLQDRDQTFVDAGLEKAREVFRKKLKKDDLIAAAQARLVADVTGEGAHSADLIIEAIFENLEAKQELFRGLEKRARADALLATNTSSIPLKQIASCLSVPSRLVGLHFFNPVALMPLVEVVHSPTTLHAAVDASCAFVRQIGKYPLPCKGLPGFLVNRILAPYMDEAFRLRAEGYSPDTIDKAATDFGMPMGPLELADSVGLDILLHVAGILSETIHRDVPPGLQEMVAGGQLGRKSGVGFYTWEAGKAIRGSADKNYPPEIQERLILSLVNEAVACVADRVVSDADLADAGTIFGAGFAPFRGGPVQYARQAGFANVKARLEALQNTFGERFSPAHGWDTLKED
jgi:3-hydroxyacyl-CoA dehydrogenase/enoyl-CoA hydratase/3-hydroxybutyryl-CoA epimerase